MGFFDKKSSSSSSTVDNTNTDNSVDNRVGGDYANLGGNINLTGVNVTAKTPFGKESGGGAINITQTDYGAIAEGIGVAKDALIFAGNQSANAFAFADKASGDATLQALGAQDVVKRSNELTTDLANKTVTQLTGLTSGISNNLTSVAQGAISQISAVVKRANESDSVEIWRIAALALAGTTAVYFLAKFLVKGGK